MILHYTAIISVLIGLISCLVISLDILQGRGQSMAIMNWVWPITGLYAGPVALLFYFRMGRFRQITSTGEKHNKAMHDMPAMPKSPHAEVLPSHPGMEEALNMPESSSGDRSQKEITWKSTFISTLHCGAGCTLGDILAEIVGTFLILEVFGQRLFGQWVISFVLAFCFGILFQYFAIKPMTQLSVRAALKEAIKADGLSLIFWQIGMYGWMAVARFIIFHRELLPADPVFWLMMQVAMIAGFFTAYPVNRLLLIKGIKKEM